MEEVQKAHADSATPLVLAGLDPDEALARLATALRAGLPGPGIGAGLMSSPAGTDPFEYFGSADGPPPVDTAAKSRHSLPGESLPAPVDSGAAVMDRRVALLTQDMAAFGVVGREASSRLEAPADCLRVEYFA